MSTTTVIDQPAAGTVKTPVSRKYPIGAEVIPDRGVHFRVWAPHCEKVAIRARIVSERDDADIRDFALDSEGNGYFSGLWGDARVGTTYGVLLNGGQETYADPASRFQPDGPMGWSEVIDPSQFEWPEGAWKSVPDRGHVVYEMHVGTFTREGTWNAATEQLPELKKLGITIIEVMPIAEFPGRFGWGYDGVNLFAPTRLYGRPDDLRRFIATAHQLDLNVVLDVVYNHIGPAGNFLPQFGPYYSQTHNTDWGSAINFDGENSEPVREFFLTNARYWVEEFHFNGLRLDATQDIHDSSPDHIISAVSRTARKAAQGRRIWIVGENEPQKTLLARPEDDGGYGIDALWNDDFHHSAMVAMTGRSEAYYTDYRGSSQEFVSLAKYGYLFQGQRYDWQKNRRGTPTRGLAPEAFVTFIQNHDQVANSGHGQRCHQICSPGIYRAMTTYLLLCPGTPMLFQGQEFAASTPFFYFADHPDELAHKVFEGRKQFLAQFRSIAQPEIQASLVDPGDPLTFTRSKLDFRDREIHSAAYQLHRDLLELRAREEVLTRRDERYDGAVLSDSCFLLRFFGDELCEDRLLIVNFGRDLHYSPAPEPLLAPPTRDGWTVLFSSEDPRYGGCGTAPLEGEMNWQIPGQAAVLLRPALPPESEETP